MSELDVLRRLGDQIVPPPFEMLRKTAHRRVRRARVATSVAIAASVVAVSATTLYLGRDTDRRFEPAPAPSLRPLTYADGSTIHYGDHTVEADGSVVELDVTDDGVGFRTGEVASGSPTGRPPIRSEHSGRRVLATATTPGR
jgi:hypothetical protein